MEKMIRAGVDPTEFLSITSYFNPSKGSLRRNNYRVFRKHLNTLLLTVEWAPDGVFELQQGDADFLIQVAGGDLVWQKECLLNIAIDQAKRLGVRCAAFVDCDIVFQNDRWFEGVSDALQTHDFVQCFGSIDYLPALDIERLTREALVNVQPVAKLESMVKRLQDGFGFYKDVQTDTGTNHTGPIGANPGMATAINLQKHPDWKFYDRNIVGGGDGLLLAAMSGYLDEFFDKGNHSMPFRAHATEWMAQHVPPTPSLAYVPNHLFHLWHGSLTSRQYTKRYEVLSWHGYNPATDVIAEPDLPLRLDPRKRELKSDIYKYLASRGDA